MDKLNWEPCYCKMHPTLGLRINEITGGKRAKHYQKKSRGHSEWANNREFLQNLFQFTVASTNLQFSNKLLALVWEARSTSVTTCTAQIFKLHSHEHAIYDCRIFCTIAMGFMGLIFAKFRNCKNATTSNGPLPPVSLALHRTHRKGADRDLYQARLPSGPIPSRSGSRYAPAQRLYGASRTPPPANGPTVGQSLRIAGPLPPSLKKKIERVAPTEQCLKKAGLADTPPPDPSNTHEGRRRGALPYLNLPKLTESRYKKTIKKARRPLSALNHEGAGAGLPTMGRRGRAGACRGRRGLQCHWRQGK